MKTYLSELLSNANASKFFWTVLTATLFGAIGWLTNLTVEVWALKSKQEVSIIENKNIKGNLKEVKNDVKEVKGDVKEIIRLVAKMSREG